MTPAHQREAKRYVSLVNDLKQDWSIFCIATGPINTFEIRQMDPKENWWINTATKKLYRDSGVNMVGWLVGWLVFTACQPLLGYLMPKSFLEAIIWFQVTNDDKNL